VGEKGDGLWPSSTVTRGQGPEWRAGSLSAYERIAFLLVLLLLTVTGLYLRLDYARTTSPYIDEYTTIWVAQRTVEYGYPVFSTGAIYALGRPGQELRTDTVCRALGSVSLLQVGYRRVWG